MKNKKLLSLLLCAVMLLGMVPATAHAAPDVTQDAFGRLSDDCWVCEWTTSVLGGNIYSYLAALGAEGYPMELFVDGVLMETLTGSAYTNYNSSYDSKTLKTIYSGSQDVFGYSGRSVSTGLYVVKGATNAESCVRIVVINTYLAQVQTDYDAGSGSLSLGVWESANGSIYFRNASASIVSEDLSGFRLGDFVAVTMTNPCTTTGTVRSVKPTQCISNINIDSYTCSGLRVTSVTSGSDRFLTSKKFFYNPNVLNNYGLETLSGYTYNIYLEQYGNMLGIDYGAGEPSYVFVVGAQISSGGLHGEGNVANIIFPYGQQLETVGFTLSESAGKDAERALSGGDGKGSPAVNAWFSCKRVREASGYSFVLEDIVPVTGENTAVRQYSDNIVHDVRSDADIDARHPSLVGRSQTGGSIYVYANGGTNYISVSVTASAEIADGKGCISEVSHRSTGIDYTAISTASVSSLASFDISTARRIEGGWSNAQPADHSNTFYLYHNNGYLIAVVSVGTDSGTASPVLTDGFAYIIDGPIKRSYYGGSYFDTYRAIIDGEINTVDVDSAKSGTTFVGNKLMRMRLHAVSRLKSGAIVAVRNFDESGNWTCEGLLPRGSSALDTSADAAAGYSFAYIAGEGADKNANVSLSGSTMILSSSNGSQNYIQLDRSCTFFVYNPDIYDFDMYSNVRTAYAAATKRVGADQCVIDSVTAVMNRNTGFASTVIFDCEYTSTSQPVSNVSVIGTSAGNYANAQFYSTEGETILYSQAISALVSKMQSDGATDIELSSVDGIPTVTFSWNGLKMNQRINSLANYNVKQSHKWTFGSKSGYLAAGEALSDVGYSGAAVILDENTLVYAGALNGFNNGLMPSYDITIVEGTDSGNALENALVLLKRVVIENALSVGAFAVPDGTALAVEDALTVTGTLTVVGNIESCADIDAGDNVIIVSGGAVYLEDNTLRFGKLIALDKAKVVAHKAVGSSIHAGGDLFFDKLDVQRIAFPGDEKNCCVEVETGLESVPDVFFGVMGSYEGYLVLPEDGSSSLGTVLVLSDGTLCNAGAIKNADGNVGSTLSFNNKGDVVTSIEEVNGGFDLQTTLGNLSIDTACDSALKADVDKSTGALTARVTVSEGENALLIAACYDLSGRQVSVDVIPVEGSASAETVNTGTYCDLYHTYRLMLVDRSTFAPLYASRAIEL